MSNNAPYDSAQPASTTTAHTRRSLVVGDADSLSLQQKLMANGYVTRRATVADAAWAIKDFVPDVIIMVVARAEGDAENEAVALARRLHAEASTYSLPMVFVWSEDDRSLRAAAHYIGADDYF